MRRFSRLAIALVGSLLAVSCGDDRPSDLTSPEARAAPASVAAGVQYEAIDLGALENGVMTDLGPHGGGFSEARDINARGQVVGTSSTGDGTRHATLWTPTN
jgi:probable HAF family extracellular repeat protein